MKRTALQSRILPDDVAKLALWPCSLRRTTDSRMITNQQFVIDGGRI